MSHYKLLEFIILYKFSFVTQKRYKKIRRNSVLNNPIKVVMA